MITIYGIANCDTCRKAIRWFEAKQLQCDFHDLRRDGITTDLVSDWLGRCSADELVNRRSATWRKLSAAERANAEDSAVIQLLVDNPTLIKRPLVDNGNALLVGYDEKAWQTACS